MLPKSQRLNLKSLNSRGVFAGKKWNSQSFSANFDFKGDDNHALINMVVNKKTFKLAVDRNKAKRLAWASLPAELAGIKKLRLVIRPKKVVFETTLKNRQQEISNLMEKIHGKFSN